MKILTVTGLSNEQDFLTGQSSFVLVLNKEIRIPITEDVAARIIQEMYHDNIEQNAEASAPVTIETSEEEDGIDQI